VPVLPAIAIDRTMPFLAAGAVVAAGQDVVPAPSGSEDQLALDFAAAVAQRFRWSPGLGWMVWQPPVWARDVGLSRYDAARTLCRAEARTTQTTAEHRRLGSAKTIQAVITLAQADRRLVMSDAAWDADPQALNTPAGLIDLRTGAACDGAEHLPTQCTVVAADFTAASPVFDRFLNAVFQGDAQLIAFVQRVAGYLLTGSTREQVLFFLYGAGANGKSTLVDLLMWLAGSYALKLPASTLMANRNGEAHPTGIAQLRGKRMAVSSELEEGAFFNESLIKELTGDETLTARFMRGDFFSFKQAQKHVIVGNYRPRLRGGDPALARRLVLVPFTATFSAAQRDPDMLAKLKAEGPAVLAWAVRGAVKWHAEGLGIPEVVRSASADYLQAHDDLQLWVDERCDRAGESKASDLYADFRQWKERRGEHAPTQTTWGERLQRLMGIERRKSNGVRYSPISIRPPEWIGPK
jgi:putative DNA primase/helicase